MLVYFDVLLLLVLLTTMLLTFAGFSALLLFLLLGLLAGFVGFVNAFCVCFFCTVHSAVFSALLLLLLIFACDVSNKLLLAFARSPRSHNALYCIVIVI